MIGKKKNQVLVPFTLVQEKTVSIKERDVYIMCAFYEEENGCRATNKELAKLCDCSKRTITRAISKLTKLGYLYVFFDKGNRCIHVIPF